MATFSSRRWLSVLHKPGQHRVQWQARVKRMYRLTLHLSSANLLTQLTRRKLCSLPTKNVAFTAKEKSVPATQFWYYWVLLNIQLLHGTKTPSPRSWRWLCWNLHSCPRGMEIQLTRGDPVEFLGAARARRATPLLSFCSWIWVWLGNTTLNNSRLSSSYSALFPLWRLRGATAMKLGNYFLFCQESTLLPHRVGTSASHPRLPSSLAEPFSPRWSWSRRRSPRWNLPASAVARLRCCCFCCDCWWLCANFLWHGHLLCSACWLTPVTNLWIEPKPQNIARPCASNFVRPC